MRLRRDSWSERLVQTAARLGTTQPSFEIAAETLSGLTRVGISESTVWRHHKEVTEDLKAELEREEQEIPIRVRLKDVEAMGWIKAREPVEQHASVSIDGLTVLIRDDGYREVKMVSVSEVVEEAVLESDGAAVLSQEGVSTDGKGQVRSRQDGIKLERHSYRAILGDKETFSPALKVELVRRGVQEVDKITTVNDGAEWIWDLVQRYLPSRRQDVLDWPHALQNLAKAGTAAFGEGSEEAQAWLAQQETNLWNGQRMMVDNALRHLPRRYKERGKAIRQVKGYIDHHWARLRYDQFRAEGRPIGSGTVESAAKNVVAWRMKRGGQRWSRPGAERMLVALGEVHSKRWGIKGTGLAKAA